MLEAAAVTLYGIFSSYLTLTDTTRSNTPDTTIDVLRFGLNVKKEKLIAKYEAQIRTDNGIQTRAASLGLLLPYDVTIQAGRLRPGGAYGYGGYWNNTPGGFAATDGMGVTKKWATADGIVVLGGLTYGNTFSIPSAGQKTVPGYQLGTPSANQGRFVVTSLAATIKKLDIIGVYGYQNKQMLVAADNTTQPATQAQMANVSYLETSIGYRPQESLSVGVFYTQKITGRPTYTNIVGGIATATDFVPLSAVTKKFTWGLGVNGDTKRLNLKDLYLPGDTLTYGLGFDRVGTRGGSGRDAQHDPRQISVNLGYNYNGNMEIFLAGSKQWSSAKIFPNKKGIEQASYSSELVTLNSLFIF